HAHLLALLDPPRSDVVGILAGEVEYPALLDRHSRQLLPELHVSGDAQPHCRLAAAGRSRQGVEASSLEQGNDEIAGRPIVCHELAARLKARPRLARPDFASARIDVFGAVPVGGHGAPPRGRARAAAALSANTPTTPPSTANARHRQPTR